MGDLAQFLVDERDRYLQRLFVTSLRTRQEFGNWFRRWLGGIHDECMVGSDSKIALHIPASQRRSDHLARRSATFANLPGPFRVVFPQLLVGRHREPWESPSVRSVLSGEPGRKESWLGLHNHLRQPSR
jgi:hypothetical protein